MVSLIVNDKVKCFCKLFSILPHYFEFW